MRIDAREFDHRPEVVLVCEDEVERSMLENAGKAGAVVVGEIAAAPGDGGLYLRVPYEGCDEEFFVDVFIVNDDTKEVHHKNLARAACNLSRIENPRLVDSLIRARLQGIDLCGWCFQSEN